MDLGIGSGLFGETWALLNDDPDAGKVFAVAIG